MIMERENMTDINYSVASVIADSSHTLDGSLSKLRSCLEAGKKQFRVWQQYVCGVIKMLLYSFFRVPLVLLLSPCDDLENVRFIQSGDNLVNALYSLGKR